MSDVITRVALVCGDWNWRALGPIQVFLRALPAGQTVVITGGAAGADTLANTLAREMGHRTVRLDAPWKAYGKRAGPVRNQWMLEMLLMYKEAYPEAVCDVHVFHAQIAASIGTVDMLRRARAAGVPYEIHADPAVPAETFVRK